MALVLCPLSEHAQKNPDHPAIITDQRVWTYRELDRETHALCHFLDQTGIQGGHRVAFIAHSSVATILLFFALFRMRAIACPLSHRLPQAQIDKAIENLKAAHVLEPSLLPPDMVRVKAGPDSLELDALATFLFTSGSSGNPKAACLTLSNHHYNALGAIDLLKLEPTSRWLLSLPLFHVSGIGILFRSFLRGSTIVLSDLLLSDAITQFGITHLSAVPTQLIRLLKEPAEKLAKIKASLKCLLLGGAPLASSLLNEANKQGLPVYTTYGMTEMGSMITLSGKLLNFREMKLENDEICVRGKTLFQGYWDPEQEIVVKEESWFPTKDLGRFTEEGNLIVTGRKDRQFISGGENIQPEEIEQALCAIPGIQRATVLSVADPDFGQRPVAFIEDETGSHTLESIRKELKERLPSFKHPVRILSYPPGIGLKPSLEVLRQCLESVHKPG